jgi:hypothetical protein
LFFDIHALLFLDEYILFVQSPFFSKNRFELFIKENRIVYFYSWIIIAMIT